MLKTKIDVTLTDGREFHLDKFGAGDLVAFERRFSVSAAVFDDEAEIRFEWLLFLVWNRLTKSGQYEGDFDGFCDLVDDLDMGGDEDEDPSVPAPLPV